MGQNFSWLKKVGHGFEQQRERRQRAGNLWDAVRRLCVENECICFCEPIKGQSKTTKTYFCLLIHENYTDRRKILDWYWATNLFVHRLPGVKTTEHSSSSWSSVSRRKWSDWILRLKDYLWKEFEISRYWSGEKWQSTVAKGGGNKKRFQYCTDQSGKEILYLRDLQGHSGRNLIDPSIQDNVLIPNNFTRVHLSHRMCNQFSLIREFRIDTRRKELQHKTDVLLLRLWILWTKNSEIRIKLTWKHRVFLCVRSKWGINIKTRCIGKKLAQKKLNFYQIRSNAIILHNTLRDYCVPKAIMIETGEIISEKVYASPRIPPKISCKDNWRKELGSEVAGGV